jgi:hypothetical protein
MCLQSIGQEDAAVRRKCRARVVCKAVLLLKMWLKCIPPTRNAGCLGEEAKI